MNNKVKKIKGKTVAFLIGRGSHCRCADCPVLYGDRCPFDLKKFRAGFYKKHSPSLIPISTIKWKNDTYYESSKRSTWLKYLRAKAQRSRYQGLWGIFTRSKTIWWYASAKMIQCLPYSHQQRRRWYVCHRKQWIGIEKTREVYCAMPCMQEKTQGWVRDLVWQGS